MSFRNVKSTSSMGGLMAGCLPIILWLYFPICWIVNLIKFINCDFEAPYKEEIIHGIGVFSGFGAGITAWF